MTQIGFDFYSSIDQLIKLGGLPVAAILALSVLIFILFFERLLFLSLSFKNTISMLEKYWSESASLAKSGLNSWDKQRVQEALLSEARAMTRHSFWLLRAAIIACPLIGLMGTVSGMVLVFDQISLSGTGNPRLMASGIFQATLPTMAGMLISIIGLIMQYILRRLSLRAQGILKHQFPLLEEGGVKA
ncbi:MULTISPECIES: MotA/TolQ/ExbB proton channel family protein [unclassified Oleiphilus]|jgi:biopolymer transport protein ExbB|uniref:MotA/TolQ/ExbB proton channel family protein n=2 Tax=Oleiphilus TaxID=141450 RepID=UPI0007C2E430|nr:MULTISPECIES: MotA/TolQ/ExbB proton channel family protein [unclassified Oleiphilus]KZY43650.1 hypothetical protein A3732_13935 [Oleiphilus sp. HI0050]KZY74081.1 hypothetical protein A3740_02995 [Oleiphilus sp. HI0068]KZY77314.1 hypothetical protein A3741_09705 [Oleiphilus sp. HI0069]KZY86146.1 hypothetical protein A3743_02705 [Oleiphilus sp. HI0072]KZZ07662.1 hypothetical protein A3749_15205 [Oleiphilus sp. HI0078]KZZ18246.1 hypothetical protein A3752_17170 [Oleiphilus sp. HI0081]